MMRSKRIRCISLNEIKKFYCWYSLTYNGSLLYSNITSDIGLRMVRMQTFSFLLTMSKSMLMCSFYFCFCVIFKVYL